MLRSIFLKLHRWSGLGAGLLLALIGLTGALLGFREELEPALSPALFRCAPQGQRASVEAVLEALARDEPAVKPLTVRLPPAEGRAFEVILMDGRVAHVDAYRPRVLGLRRRDTGLFFHTQRLHTQLVLGDRGGLLVAACTALFLGLSLTGVVIGWPRRGQVKRALTLRLGGGGKRLNHDLHTVLGLYTALVLLVLSGSGLALYGGQKLFPALERLAGSAPLPKPPAPPELTPGRALARPDEAIAAADRALPDATTVALALPQGKAGFYTVHKRFPEDKTPIGRTRVRVDPFTAEVRSVEATRSGTWAQQLPMRMRGWHTGDALGFAGRSLWSLTSAWSAGLALTGLLMWWWRQKKA